MASRPEVGKALVTSLDGSGKLCVLSRWVIQGPAPRDLRKVGIARLVREGALVLGWEAPGVVGRVVAAGVLPALAFGL